MKSCILTVLLLCGSLAFAESPEVRITAAQPAYEGFRFEVVADLIQPKIYWVVVAVWPGKKSDARKEAYIEISDDKKFAYANVLKSCTTNDIPDQLQTKIRTPDAILFTFKVGASVLNGSWFFYQLPRTSEAHDPVNCVIELSEFIKEPSGPN
jgi:hypothetical protein